MTDTPPKDQDGGTGRFGHRHFRPEPGETRLGLAEGLEIEWKAPDAAPVTARAERRDGLDCVTIELPAGLGWARLSCALGREGAGAGLLGCRALLAVTQHDDGAPFGLRPTLALVHRGKGRARGLEASGATLDPAPGAWQDITGAFLRAPDPDGHETRLLIDLPQDSRVTLALVETRWFDAAPEAESRLAARLQSDEVVPLAGFTARTHPAEDVAAQAGAPAVFASHVALDDLSLDGWVLAGTGGRATPGAPEVMLRAGTRRLGLTANCPAAPMPGLRLDCGFAADVLPLLTEAEFETGLPAQISCHLRPAGADGPDQPDFDLPASDQSGPDPSDPAPAFAGVPVPAASAWLHPERALAAGDKADRQEALLFDWPADPGRDPYRRLLARGMARTVTAPGGLDAAIVRLEAEKGRQVSLHLHALPPLLEGAQSAAQAEEIRERLTARLRYFVHLGGTLLWTVHDLPDLDGANAARPPFNQPDRPTQDRPAPPFTKTLHALGHDIAALARVVHVHGQALVAPLVALWPVPSERIVVAPHPSYIGHYPDYVTRAEARARLDLPRDVPVFLLFGRVGPDKPIERALAAFAALRRKTPEAHLLVVGMSVRADHKGMLRRRFGALPNVHVTETQVSDPALQWYHKAADWSLNPYERATTPGAMICAMSFGLPAIAPRLGMLPDLVRPGETGLLYDPEAPDGLEQALIAAAGTEPQATAEMGARARERVARQSWSALGHTLEAALAARWPSRRISLPFEDRTRGAVLLGRPFPPERPAATAVIVLNYGDGEDAARLIGSLRAQTVQDFDIYLVDNASPEMSAGDLAVRFGDVHVLRLNENLGYAGGNNAALRLIADLPYAYLWILNPDITAPPEALACHLQAAEAHPDHAIFGPVLRRSADERRVASAGSRLSFEGGLSTGNLYAGELLEVLPDAPYEADFLTGAALFLRRAILDEIGLIPERYFLYFEETDWLVGAARKGHPSLVVPQVRLTHHKRSEAGDLPATYYFYYYLRNSLLFEARMGPGDSALVAARLRAEFIATWLGRIAGSAPERLPVYEALARRALEDGLAGRHGPVDLVAMELAALGPDPLPLPDPDELASLTVGVDGTGWLRGRVMLTMTGPCMVAASVGQRLLAVMPAEPAGKPAQGGRTAHVFGAALPGWMRDGAGHRISFRINGQPVPGGDLDLFLDRPKPEPAGAIQQVNRHVCTGWLRDMAAPDRVLTAEILSGDRVIGRGPACHPVTAKTAADIPEGGVAPPPGATGSFEIRLPKRFADGAPHALRLRIAGTSQDLAEAELADSAFARGDGAQAPQKPPRAVLEDMMHRGPLWLGAHPIETLPIWRHLDMVRAALVQRHAARPADEQVSIVMPVFNGAGTIGAAIRSVLAQSHDRWELLIVDDASTDDTREILDALLGQVGDDRIRLIRQAHNGGVSAARNAALAQARGAIIAYLDCDDLWDPDYLAVMTGEMAGTGTDPARQAAYCGHLIGQTGMTDHPEDPTAMRHAAPQDPDEAPAPPTEILGLGLRSFHMAMAENQRLIRLSGFVHRRALLERLGGFDPAMRRFGDRALILRYAAEEIPHHVPAALVTVRTDLARPSIAMTEPAGLATGQLADHIDRMAGLARVDPDPPLRPVDVVLMAAEIAEATALRRRIEEIAPTLPPGRGSRLIVQADPAVARQLADMAEAPNGPRIRQVEAQSGSAAALADALALRQAGADLALLEPRALVLPGWIEAINRAIGRVPDGGMFVPRHGLGGRAPAARRHAPWSWRQADACIALSEQLRNLRDPLLDRRENLMEITGFLPFCVLVPADVAAMLRVPDPAPAPQPDLSAARPVAPAQDAAPSAPTGPDRATILGEWADFTRLHLGRKLVYCGLARAFELPL